MAFSYVLYNGDGATTNYAFSFPYLDPSHIKVRVDGVLTSYTFLNSSTVTISPAPAVGTVIEIRRETPKDNPPVNFTDGSVLLERDLDLLAEFNLYTAQEAADGVGQSITQDSLGVWQAQNRRIANVADPVNLQDAVNRRYFENVYTPQLDAKVSEATTQASNAATSASQAATSATNSANSASASATSASNAATSETNAANSASASATSASESASSASAAATSASNAATSATNAANSATASANSATASASSASAAATSETNAANSATASATSASNAATSETNAAASAVSAANSAAAAATALDNFDDRYLGAFASDPTTDNDGDPLVTGALYFNTTSGKMRVYEGTGWIDASSASVATLATFEFIATAGQTTFTGNDANGVGLVYTVGALIVSLNGVILQPGDDYTATDGSSIVLVSGAALNDELTVYAFGNFVVADTYSRAEADAEFLRKAGEDGVTVSSGAVKIGTGTASNGTKLDVEGSIISTDNSLLSFNADQAGLDFISSSKIGRVFTTSSDTTGGDLEVYTGKNGSYALAAKFDANQNLSFNSGYGSAATAYGCRAWVNFNGTGTVAIRASGNVSSITDTGTGAYTVNFTTAMPDADYVGLGTSTTAGQVTTVRIDTDQTASACRFLCNNVSNPAIDASVMHVAFFR